MSQTKAQLLDNIKDNVQLDARNSLRFADTDSSHYVAFKAPATVSSNVTWTLPAADGSANYVLATDGSGNLSWIADPAGQWVTSGSNIYFTGGNVGIGDTSPSNPLSVTGASAFNGDVTFTGASYNALWDKSANALEFADSAKASFGAGEDLSIYHTDPNGFIKYQNENGHLRILSGVSGNGGIQLKNRTDDETYLTCISDGAVELYHNNTKRFETSSSGVKMPDTAQFELGDGSDLKMWHSGSHSFIRNETGNLTIEANGAGDDAIVCIPDGAVELYHDNSKKLSTGSGGIVLHGSYYTNDGNSIYLGSDNDLRLYHDGNNSYIDHSGAGDLYIRTLGSQELIRLNAAKDIELRVASGNDVAAKFITDGAVELYYDNAKVFYTESYGAVVKRPSGGDTVLEVIGCEGQNAQISMFADDGDDNADKWRFVSSQNGNFYLQNYAGGAWETSIVCSGNGTVELYNDDSKQFQTASNGLMLNGGAKITRSSNSNDPIIESTNSQYAKSTVFGGWDSSNTAGVSRVRNSNDNLHFDSGSGGIIYCQAYSGNQTQTKALEPMDNDTHDCGSNSYKWDDIYATNGTIQTSDRNQKNTIVDSDLGLSFVNKLKPVSYKYNSKTRTHYGLIAQDVETVLSDISKPTTGFAGFIKEAMPDEFYQEAEPNIPEGKNEGDLKVAAHTEYGLRYGEFISPLIKAVQELSTKIETLETKVAALESA